MVSKLILVSLGLLTCVNIFAETSNEQCSQLNPDSQYYQDCYKQMLAGHKQALIDALTQQADKTVPETTEPTPVKQEQQQEQSQPQQQPSNSFQPAPQEQQNNATPNIRYQ